MIGPERLNWTEARKYCDDRNAHLAIIPEAGEQEKIKTLLRDLRMVHLFSFLLIIWLSLQRKL